MYKVQASKNSSATLSTSKTGKMVYIFMLFSNPTHNMLLAVLACTARMIVTECANITYKDIHSPLAQ